jgi:hypothetical protein
MDVVDGLFNAYEDSNRASEARRIAQARVDKAKEHYLSVTDDCHAPSESLEALLSLRQAAGANMEAERVQQEAVRALEARKGAYRANHGALSRILGDRPASTS